MQTRADLGCGSGVFTAALATILQVGSRIHAIDIDRKVILQLPKEYDGVSMQTSVIINNAKDLFLNSGAQSFEVLNTRRSVFGSQLMYSALIKK